MKTKKSFYVALTLIIAVAIGTFIGIRVARVYAVQSNLKKVRSVMDEKTMEYVTDVETEAKAEVEAEVDEKLDSVPDYTCEKTVTNCVGNIYGEGEAFGLINYNGTESAVVVGTQAESLEGQAMLHSASTSDHIVVLGHSYADGSVFGCLAINHSAGVQVELSDLNGTQISYTVVSSEWVNEDLYNSSEYIRELFEDDSDVVLITCHKENGCRGRLIVKCEQNV